MTLVAFDFDGTLSDSEMTVLLGDRKGVADEMADITERAMNDEISYAKSLRDRAALLEGLPEEDAEAAFSEVELRPDAGAVLRELDEAGVTTAILTGGFERGVEAALEREGVSVDVIVANRLPVTDGDSEALAASEDASGRRGGSTASNETAKPSPGPRALTGEVEGPLIEGTKDDALKRLAAEREIAVSDTVAVGDGANDLPMLEVAGLAVGFLPKPAVEPSCDVTVATMEALRDVFDDEGLLD